MIIKNKINEALTFYQQQQRKQQQKINILSNLRLGAFVLGLGISALLYSYGQVIYCSFFLTVMLFVFFLLVNKHQQARAEFGKTRCLSRINQNNLARLDGEWRQFVDTGAEFSSAQHPYLNDLDIFGQQSLFQLINITNTYMGRHTLKGMLEKPLSDIEKIKIRQQATKELAAKAAFLEELQCAGMILEGGLVSPEKLISYAKSQRKLFAGAWLQKLFFLLPALTLITLLLTLTKLIPAYVFGTLVLVQVILTIAGFSKVSAAVDTIHKFKDNIKVYEKILKLIEQQNFCAEELINNKALLKGSTALASNSIKKLERIAEAVDARYNMISYGLLNFLLLWDYHCVFALEKWKQQDGKLLHEWLLSIGYFEALASLANLYYLNPSWCFPDLSENKRCFDGEEIGHPLLDAKERVSNNLALYQGLGIITGSNMSGKTTMLRTVGINLVLAYTGAPVCAKALRCSVMDIFTSMRISDDLGSGISTFYAELLRIKKILEHAKTKQPMIFLIDEVFRGTNSNDRITGALSVLRHLNQDWVIGLISTHDFELCSLEQEQGIQAVNYHFLDSYQAGEIKFDYKIRPGRCYTSNAKFLMQMIGIEIID